MVSNANIPNIETFSYNFHKHRTIISKQQYVSAYIFMCSCVCVHNTVISCYIKAKASMKGREHQRCILFIMHRTYTVCIEPSKIGNITLDSHKHIHTQSQKSDHLESNVRLHCTSGSFILNASTYADS